MATRTNHLELSYAGNPRVREFSRGRKQAENTENDMPKPDLRWHGDEDEIDGITYRLVVEEDYLDVEDSDQVLGTITDYPTTESSWKINPEISHNCYDSQEAYWNPMEEIEEHASYFQKAGASKQVARELALASEKWAMRRRLSYGTAWFYTTLVVEAYILGVRVGSASLGGIESDFTESKGYAEDIISELADEARSEAQRSLQGVARFGR